MTKTLTIRTEDEILEQLDAVAEGQQRSRNFVANQALKDYLSQQGKQAEGLGVPVAEHLEDYQSQFWVEDDLDDFEVFLKQERERSLEGELFKTNA